MRTGWPTVWGMCVLLLLTARSGGADPIPQIEQVDWPSYNYDARGWRFNQGETTLSVSNAAQLEEKWRFPTKASKQVVGAIHATPIVVNGHTYFGTATYPAFYKLKPDGSLAWVYQIGTGRTKSNSIEGVNAIDVDRGVLSSALVTTSSVFFGNAAGTFYALDRLTGEQRWKVDTRGEEFPNPHPANAFSASAIAVGKLVIVGGGSYEHPRPLPKDYLCCTGRGFVVAFDAAKGDVVWKYDVGEPPQKYPEPVTIEDVRGEHVFHFGPSTSSVWSTPSYDVDTDTIFFGTDVHNSPRLPSEDDPRDYSKYTAAVIAVDAKSGREKWVTQLTPGPVYNLSMVGYDPGTGRYRDSSVGDTPKVYEIDYQSQPLKVLGVGCKNGGFYVLRASNGELLEQTPVFEGQPERPLRPAPDPRMLALPSPIGGLQTGCATDGTRVYTNGIDWLSINTTKGGLPEAGRVVSVSTNLDEEFWRHERPKVRAFFNSGDPVAAGIALGGGLACFAPTVSQQLVVLDASNGKVLKQLPIETAWSGPSISRGRVFVGTGSILFLKQQNTGTLYSFGLPGEDELDRMTPEPTTRAE